MRASVCMRVLVRVRVRVRVCACACAYARARARPNGRAARRGPRRGWERTPQPCVRRRQSRNPRPRPPGVGRIVVVTPRDARGTPATLLPLTRDIRRRAPASAAVQPQRRRRMEICRRLSRAARASFMLMRDEAPRPRTAALSCLVRQRVAGGGGESDAETGLIYICQALSSEIIP